MATNIKKEVHAEKMTAEQIIEAVTNVKNGRMARIGYATELPIRKEFNDLGYVIKKVVETTARFGCRYDKLEAVQTKKAQEDPSAPKRPRANNEVWTVPNKICHNTNTGKDYVRFAPLNRGGSNKKSTYIMTIKGTEGFIKFTVADQIPENLKAMVQSSYWTKRSAPDVQNVCIDNVLFVK